MSNYLKTVSIVLLGVIGAILVGGAILGLIIAPVAYLVTQYGDSYITAIGVTLGVVFIIANGVYMERCHKGED